MNKQSDIQVDATTASHKSIAAALAAAQSEMGRAKKSAKNPHFKSKYADLDSVCDAAMPALNRHGIAVIQPLEKDGDDWLVLTRFVHDASGETMETPMPLLIGKRDMQGLGSAITYARRYGLMTLAGIAPEDDDGNPAVNSVRNDPPPPPGPSREAVDTAANSLLGADSVEQLRAIWSELPRDVQAVQKVLQAKDSRKMQLDSAPNADLGGDEIPY